MSAKGAAIPENGTTPKCRRFLKRSSNFVQEEYIHLQKSIFANTVSVADERKRTTPSVEDEDELLALCAWWSDSENFYDDESSDNEEEGDEEEEESYFKTYVLTERQTNTEMAVAQRELGKRHESCGLAGESNDLDEFFRADFFGHETDEPEEDGYEDETGEDSVDGPLTTLCGAAAVLRRLPTEFDLEASF